MAITIDVASDSTLQAVAEKLERQNEILSGGAITIKGDNVFVRYSANVDGTDFTEEWSSDKHYIGFATGQEAPTNKEDYMWAEFIGKDGVTPHIGDNGNWYIGNTDTGVVAAALAEGATVVQTVGDSEAAVMSQKAVTDIVSPLIDIAYSNNVLDPNGIKFGILLGANGTEYSGDSYSSFLTTDYISCKSGDTIRRQFDWNGVRYDNEDVSGYSLIKIIVAFDADKTVIASVNDVTHYTVPENTAFVRLSLYTSTYNQDPYSNTAIIIQDDKTVQPYEEYIEGGYRVETKEIPNIVQTVGDSETAVMSQKAVTEEFENISSLVIVNEDSTRDLSVPYHDGMMSQKGTVYTGDSYANYRYTDKISVKEGEVLTYYKASILSAYRTITAYSGDTVVYELGTQEGSTYTVPSGIDYVVVTFSMPSDELTIARTFKIKGYATAIKSENKYNERKQIYKSSGDYVSEIDFSQFRTSTKSLCLNAVFNFSSFTELNLGFKDDSGNDTYTVSINNTKIITSDRGYSNNYTTNEYTHGLTISGNLQVLLLSDNKGDMTIKICSQGIDFSSAIKTPTMAYIVHPFCNFTGTATDHIFTASLPNILKDIWMFGDSYFGVGTSRWMHYLLENNDKRVMIDAYGGENSANSLVSLYNALQMGKPKVIIWCLGMNDGTDDTTISTKWQSAIEEVESICESSNIKLILATIPSVPNINHELKNEYVRNSGHQYIDFARAVGASANGVWYNGMLSDDNVHPSSTGAKTLYYEAIASAPQLLFE